MPPFVPDPDGDWNAMAVELSLPHQPHRVVVSNVELGTPEQQVREALHVLHQLVLRDERGGAPLARVCVAYPVTDVLPPPQPDQTASAA